MSNRYVAENVVVLRLSNEPDADGHIIPPSAQIKFEKNIPVFFEFQYDTVVGWAKLKLEKNTIVAKLDLFSEVEDQEEAYKIMKTLYPSTAFAILKMEKGAAVKILEFEIKAIGLTRNKNVDSTILQLGNKVKAKGKGIVH